MKCSEVEGWISDFVDNELRGEKEVKVRAHLEECRNCRKLYKLELSTKNLVKSINAKRSPAGLRERILTSISDADTSVRDDEKIIKPLPWVWGFVSKRSVAFATAAAVLVFAAVFLYVTGIFGGIKISPFIDSVYAYHAGPSGIELSIQGGCEQIQKELSNHLQREIPVPSLDDINFKVEGANAGLKMEGRHCAVVRYEGDKEKFSHFVICSTDVPIGKLPGIEGKPDLRYTRRNGINMVFWRCEATKTTRCVALKCPMDELDELVEIVEQIRRRSKEMSAK